MIGRDGAREAVRDQSRSDARDARNDARDAVRSDAHDALRDRRSVRVVSVLLWLYVLLVTTSLMRPPMAPAGFEFFPLIGAVCGALAPMAVILAAAYLHRVGEVRLGIFGRLWVAATALWIGFECLRGLIGYGNPPADVMRDLLCYLTFLSAVRMGCSAIFWRAARIPLIASVGFGALVLLASWYEMDDAFRFFGPTARVVRDVSLGRSAFMLGCLPILLLLLRRIGWIGALTCTFAISIWLLLHVMLQRRLEVSYLALVGSAAVAMAALPARMWLPTPRISRGAALVVLLLVPMAVFLSARRDLLVVQGSLLAGRLQGVGVFIPETGIDAGPGATLDPSEQAMVAASGGFAASGIPGLEPAPRPLTEIELAQEARFAPHRSGAREYTAGAFGPLTSQNERFQVVRGCLADFNATEVLLGRGLGGAFRWPAYAAPWMHPDLRAARVRLHWIADQGYVGRREMEVGHGNPLLKGGVLFVVLLASASVAAVWRAMRPPWEAFRIACLFVVVTSFLYGVMGGDYLPSATYRSLITGACIGWLLAERRRLDPWAVRASAGPNEPPLSPTGSRVPEPLLPH